MPTPFGGEVRELPYPIDRAVSLQVTTPDGEEVCGIPDFPEDSDERITVLFRLSLNEFVALASAIDAGIDPAYGSQAQRIWWIWVANVMCASFCEEVEQCITTDAAVQTAIDNFTALQMFAPTSAIYQAMVAQIPGFPGVNPQGVPRTTEQQAIDQADAPEHNPTCDLDILWAQCLALTQQTNRAIVDVFEVVEAATNTVELIDTLSEIPFIGFVKEVLGIDITLDLIQYYQNSVAEGYNAQYTTDVENEIACELFCLCRGDCQVTTGRMYEVVSTRMATHFTIPGITDLLELSQFVTGVTISGTTVVDAAFFMAWGAVAFGNFLFGGRFDNGVQLILALMADEPSNDWTLLCSECDNCADYNFVLDSFSPIWKARFDPATENDLSSYLIAVGWTPVNNFTGSDNFQNQIYILNAINCDNLHVEYSAANTPTQADLFFCNADFSVLSLAASLNFGTGVVSTDVDLTALTPPTGATGYLLVSSSTTDVSSVCTWRVANFT